MHAVDVVRLHCISCGAFEYYSRFMEVGNVSDVHVCRGTVNSKFTGPMSSADDA